MTTAQTTGDEMEGGRTREALTILVTGQVDDERLAELWGIASDADIIRFETADAMRDRRGKGVPAISPIAHSKR